jgi:hypothetical protein
MAIAVSGRSNLALAQQPRENTTPPVESSDVIERAELPRGIRQMPQRQPEIFFCETEEASCRSTVDSFSIDETRELFVFVTLPGVGGQHLETVEFVLPDGEIYHRKKTQVQIGTAPWTSTSPSGPDWNERAREVGPATEAPHLIADANLQHESGVRSLITQSRGETTLLTVLPIAGTYITQRALTGTWQVRVFLEDQPIAATTLELYSDAERNPGGNQEKAKSEKGPDRARSPKS